MRYVAWRSHRNLNIHVICTEGLFDDLPLLIRQLGPWRATRDGQLTNLRPLYRALIAQQTFAVVYLPLKDFEPEATRPAAR